MVGEGRQCILDRQTDKSLTRSTGALDPRDLGIVFISPRTRAHKTFHLLFEHLPKFPDHVITEEAREWDYGDYEGLFKEEILAKQPGWAIWRDGYVSRLDPPKCLVTLIVSCPGGESVDEMRSRVDGMITKVKQTCRFALMSN